MQYNDHEPPHFHAVYGGERVMVFIDTAASAGKNSGGDTGKSDTMDKVALR